jgi:hypothetical protein
MTQNPNDQKQQNVGEQKKTCEVCHQTFSSDRELQVHKQNAHAQRKQSGGESGTEHNQQQDQQKREKIA